MDRVTITQPAIGICHMQVCVVADATDEEILKVCNEQNPAGTERGWVTVRADRVPCEVYSGRLHVMVVC
jgi:hypothetical protein